jgi:hypothetical protein
VPENKVLPGIKDGSVLLSFAKISNHIKQSDLSVVCCFSQCVQTLRDSTVELHFHLLIILLVFDEFGAFLQKIIVVHEIDLCHVFDWNVFCSVADPIAVQFFFVDF